MAGLIRYENKLGVRRTPGGEIGPPKRKKKDPEERRANLARTGMTADVLKELIRRGKNLTPEGIASLKKSLGGGGSSSGARTGYAESRDPEERMRQRTSLMKEADKQRIIRESRTDAVMARSRAGNKKERARLANRRAIEVGQKAQGRAGYRGTITMETGTKSAAALHGFGTEDEQDQLRRDVSLNRTRGRQAGRAVAEKGIDAAKTSAANIRGAEPYRSDAEKHYARQREAGISRGQAVQTAPVTNQDASRIDVLNRQAAEGYAKAGGQAYEAMLRQSQPLDPTAARAEVDSSMRNFGYDQQPIPAPNPYFPQSQPAGAPPPSAPPMQLPSVPVPVPQGQQGQQGPQGPFGTPGYPAQGAQQPGMQGFTGDQGQAGVPGQSQLGSDAFAGAHAGVGLPMQPDSSGPFAGASAYAPGSNRFGVGPQPTGNAFGIGIGPNGSIFQHGTAGGWPAMKDGVLVPPVNALREALGIRPGVAPSTLGAPGAVVPSSGVPAASSAVPTTPQAQTQQQRMAELWAERERLLSTGPQYQQQAPAQGQGGGMFGQATPTFDEQTRRIAAQSGGALNAASVQMMMMQLNQMKNSGDARTELVAKEAAPHLGAINQIKTMLSGENWAEIDEPFAFGTDEEETKRTADNIHALMSGAGPAGRKAIADWFANEVAAEGGMNFLQKVGDEYNKIAGQMFNLGGSKQEHAMQMKRILDLISGNQAFPG